MKQTAVEWLKQQLETYGNTQYCELEWETLDDLVEQAKAMEKEQIIDAWDNGCEDDGIIDNAEQYYKENYQKEEQ